MSKVNPNPPAPGTVAAPAPNTQAPQTAPNNIPPPGQPYDPSMAGKAPPEPLTYTQNNPNTASSNGEPSPHKLKQMGRRALIAGGLLTAASGVGFALMAHGIRLRNNAAEGLREGRRNDSLDNVQEENLQKQSNRGDIFMIAGAFTGPLMLIGAATSFAIGATLYAKGKKASPKINLAPVLNPQFAGANVTLRF